MPPSKPGKSRSSRSKKFALGLGDHRRALAASQATATAAVAAGKIAVAKAKKAKDVKALKANLKTLALARRSEKNLAAAVKLVKASCCDQFFGCDLKFD
jgi:hypothetical protein